MKSLLYTKSSPGYGKENDISYYEFELKIKKRKIVFVHFPPLDKINYLPVDRGNILKETILNN